MIGSTIALWAALHATAAPPDPDALAALAAARSKAERHPLTRAQVRDLVGGLVQARLWFGVPEDLELATLETESRYDVGADSGTGCRGLGQTARSTARAVAKAHGWKYRPHSVRFQVLVSAAYLASLRGRDVGWRGALARYNLGPSRWRRTGRRYLTDYVKIVEGRRDDIRGLLPVRKWGTIGP